MNKFSMSKERKDLLLRLKHIVGNECCYGNIQNWGTHGLFMKERREFRYPITFLAEDGMKEKSNYPSSNIESSKLITGYYAFDANQLQIMRALDQVINLLEDEFNLKIDSSSTA